MTVAGKAGSSSSASLPGSVVSRGKEQFRSHSLPIGSQLNADWSVSTPAGVSASGPARTPGPAPGPATAPVAVVSTPHDSTVPKHAARVSINLHFKYAFAFN